MMCLKVQGWTGCVYDILVALFWICMHINAVLYSSSNITPQENTMKKLQVIQSMIPVYNKTCLFGRSTDTCELFLMTWRKRKIQFSDNLPTTLQSENKREERREKVSNEWKRFHVILIKVVCLRGDENLQLNTVTSPRRYMICKFNNKIAYITP